MLAGLKQFHDDLRKLRTALKGSTAERVTKASDRAEAERLGTMWFDGLQAGLEPAISAEVAARYSAQFRELLDLAGGRSRRTAYVRLLDAVLKSFRRDLILSSQTSKPGTPSQALLAGLLVDLPDQVENSYLAEAVACATHSFYRAAVVLGWCAAMDRIHRVIEQTGFARFNVASARMASETKGRFKRFNSPQNVSSVSELRGVFDTNVLWILEGMGFIDLNQHTRLRSCFELRTQSAHPGDAPITEYNLLSYFSDLREIVLVNPRFAISSSP